MQPSEFWKLSPTEFWWEFDMKLASNKKLEEMRDKAGGKPGFTSAEWETARRKFRERENAAANSS